MHLQFATPTMKWTPEEDRILLRLCKAQQQRRADGIVKDWNGIARALPNRSNKDCRKRWYNVVSGSTRKGSWSQEEDSRLINAVGLLGTSNPRPSWASVSELVGNRSADQCAKRWQQNLNPDLEHGKWTKEECQTLLDAVQSKGRKWLQIRDEHFPKRATNNIKNQYHILTKDHANSSHRKSRSFSREPTDREGTESENIESERASSSIMDTTTTTMAETNHGTTQWRDESMTRFDPMLPPPMTSEQQDYPSSVLFTNPFGPNSADKATHASMSEGANTSQQFVNLAATTSAAHHGQTVSAGSHPESGLDMFGFEMAQPYFSYPPQPGYLSHNPRNEHIMSTSDIKPGLTETSSSYPTPHFFDANDPRTATMFEGDSRPTAAKITIHEPTPYVVNEIMALVRRHNRRASVELEFPKYHTNYQS